VLGQQSFERPMTPAEEEKWKQKMANLKTFQDINQDVTTDETPIPTDGAQIATDKKDKESKEKSDIDKFLEEW